jgi:hypothetical protein
LDKKLTAPVAESIATVIAALEILTLLLSALISSLLARHGCMTTGTFGLGTVDVGLATTCTTRSPHSSTRIVPPAVRNVIPFASLWNSLMANCEELAGHAAEAKVVKRRKSNPRVWLVILFLD